ncbi:hypothetical protein LTR56_023313 [Elasticomyces elasticus]|nr:hypothetical protein LTR56_023313 [Elasticomyces elasticus]KAK3629848.1 hypothetical protein LTR22_021741 [Elasticomyces elasticus]KAK4908829.1 hypothetical protein LTR49_022333 [Elasticomyces elasticus]KAK5743904.1 hypothetical protein LTS12_023668 [Elasticomyces elasticus]
MATTSIGGLYAGRCLIGLANGLFMTFSQLYIQECSPAAYRGLLISAFQFWTSIGTLVGTVVDNFTAPLPGKACYLIPLRLIYVIPFFIAIGLFFIPESPRWLSEKGQVEKAKNSLSWLRPNQDAVEGELLTIQNAIEESRANSGTSVFLEMFRGTNLRRTMLAVGAVNTQAAPGAMFMIAYGTYFFAMAGVGKPFENSVALVAVGVIAIIINTCVITRFGRRRIFLISGLLLCAVTMLIIAAVYTVKPNADSTKNLIVAMSSSTGFLGAWLATFTAPYFINPDALNWGPRYGYIWVPPCLLAAAWVFFFLPEVKGRSLEKIDEMFACKIPARKFRGYVCTSRSAIGSKMRNAENDDEDNDKKGPTVQTIERVFGDEKGVVSVAETAMHVA